MVKLSYGTCCLLLLLSCEPKLEFENPCDSKNEPNGSCQAEDGGSVESPTSIGDPCERNADCPGGSCLDYTGGYCSQDCQARPECPSGSSCWSYADGRSFCLKSCRSVEDCRANEGYICDSDNSCFPAPEEEMDVGKACREDSDCQTDFCIQNIEGGYCSRRCEEALCPGEASCWNLGESGKFCLLSCQESSECREDEGYLCDPDNSCWLP